MFTCSPTKWATSLFKAMASSKCLSTCSSNLWCSNSLCNQSCKWPTPLIHRVKSTALPMHSLSEVTPPTRCSGVKLRARSAATSAGLQDWLLLIAVWLVRAGLFVYACSFARLFFSGYLSASTQWTRTLTCAPAAKSLSAPDKTEDLSFIESNAL